MFSKFDSNPGLIWCHLSSNIQAIYFICSAKCVLIVAHACRFFNREKHNGERICMIRMNIFILYICPDGLEEQQCLWRNLVSLGIHIHIFSCYDQWFEILSPVRVKLFRVLSLKLKWDIRTIQHMTIKRSYFKGLTFGQSSIVCEHYSAKLRDLSMTWPFL